jgi:hypothetical protein
MNDYTKHSRQDSGLKYQFHPIDQAQGELSTPHQAQGELSTPLSRSTPSSAFDLSAEGLRQAEWYRHLAILSQKRKKSLVRTATRGFQTGFQLG